MAPLAKSLALAGSLFAAFSAAAPVDKRAIDIVYETTTTIVWTTVDVTTTVRAPKPTKEAPAPPTTTISVAEVVPTQAPAPAPQVPAPPAPKPEPAQPTTTAAPVVPTTTSVPQPIVAVEKPSSSEESQPETTAAPAPVPTTSVVVPPEPQPTQSTSTGGSSGGSSGGYSGACSKGAPCTGEVTFYDTATLATNPSSCGWTNDGESENVLALPVGIMKDSDCGRTVTVKYGGVTSVGKVVDKCMGCDSSSIDLSRHFFGELASFDEGRLFDVEWFME